MNGVTTFRNTLALLALLGVAGPAVAQETDEPAPQEVWFGDDVAVTYAARLEGDWLVVEVRHEPGWHTYAMDNVERAREATGRDRADTELPTRITPSSEIELASGWRQTAPTDLSQPDIRWYTWGFEDRSFFAARVARADADAWVQVDAQACTDRLCAMVDALRVPVTRSGERSIDPATLTAVGDGGARQDATATARGRLAAFGDRFLRALDVECAGRVPVARLVEIMDPGRNRPRQLNAVMVLDADEDGFVEPGEVGEGLTKNLQQQVERRMHGDVDGDDALSSREYALFVPDPGAETNRERVSERQEAIFARLNRNGDRRVSRAEIVDDMVANYLFRYWAGMVVYHLRRADSNGDGALSESELTSAVEAAGGAASAGAADAWFNLAPAEVPAPTERRLSLSTPPPGLFELAATAAGRALLEAPLAPLLEPACGPEEGQSP